MTGSCEVKTTPSVWETPASKPLDETVWRAWVLKGIERDRRSSATFARAVQWGSIAALLVASVLWAQIAPYAVFVRFVVTVGAIVMMARALRARQYAFAAVFAALVVLYNPVAPIFGFSGASQHAFVAGTAAVFAASLVWRKERVAQNA